MANPLRELARYGQSVWYDSLRRGILASGELARYIADDGLTGLTTNPAIYEKAISGSRDYDAELAVLLARPDLDAKAVYDALSFHDIQAAADLLRPVYERTARSDGYVSLEVSPVVARDAGATLAEARRLWQALDRPNVMIKVPGTPEALPAIRQLLSEGVNVNVTLLFSRAAYAGVAEAHLAALEERAARGEDLSRLASVASFFVSRIDALVDPLLEELGGPGAPGGIRERAEALRGRVAIANAKLAYQDWRALTSSPRWARLALLGARPQRLLWASTSTKNPRYRDVMYVEELIGPDTVDTVPPATFEAFRDHGRVGPTLEADVEGARRTLSELADLGISMDDVTGRLLVEGLRLFAEPFAKLLAAIEGRRAAPASAPSLLARAVHTTPCSGPRRVATLDELVERDRDHDCGGFGLHRVCVKVEAVADLPTRFGRFRIVAFWNDRDGKEHVALVHGDVMGADEVPTRLHSECLTGDALGSLRCDCRDQLESALRELGSRERGLLLYLRQEGRGIGLVNKVRAYALQDGGLDTVEANLALGFRDDQRDYAIAAHMLFSLNVSSVRLMTNNPDKVAQLERHGIRVVRRVPHVMRPNEFNRFYLKTKAARSGHYIDGLGKPHLLEQGEPVVVDAHA